MTPDVQILIGDAREHLFLMPPQSVHCCVTSPPYFGLRDYGMGGQLGLEAAPAEYVANLVDIFREVRRALRDDGTLWLVLGDSYNSGASGGLGGSTLQGGQTNQSKSNRHGRTPAPGLKHKDLIGIPSMVAFALREDGWYLRSEIIWHKPNPMPESVTDRPTCAHEKIFLLTKSPRYYYDAAAIRNPPSPALVKQVEEGYNGQAVKDYIASGVQDASATKSRIIEGARKRIDKQRGHGRRHAGFNDKWDALTPAEQGMLGSNKRNVWTVAPANYREAHFATFPPDLILPCVLAGCPIGGTVLDPFAGSGTTGMVAKQNGRNSVLIELNPDYEKLIRTRCDLPLTPLAARG